MQPLHVMRRWALHAVAASCIGSSRPYQPGILFDGQLNKDAIGRVAVGNLNMTGSCSFTAQPSKQIALGIVCATNTTHCANLVCVKCSHAQEVGGNTFCVYWPAMLPGGKYWHTYIGLPEQGDDPQPRLVMDFHTCVQ